MTAKDPKAQCPVEGCGSRSFHFRYKTSEIVCHRCGTISPWGDQKEKANPIREKLLNVMRAQERACPGASSIMYKKANAACKYMGPLDDEICKLMDEGLVTGWSPYGCIYYNSDDPLVISPEREEQIAAAAAEGRDIRATKAEKEGEGAGDEKKIDPRAS